MKRKIEYTRRTGKKEIVECGPVLYNLILFVKWMERIVEKNGN